MQTCEYCGEATSDVRECRSCEAKYCDPCRELAFGSKEKCPQCNGYVGDDDNCRIGGGGCGK